MALIMQLVVVVIVVVVLVVVVVVVVVVVMLVCSAKCHCCCQLAVEVPVGFLCDAARVATNGVKIQADEKRNSREHDIGKRRR
jgi:flagellar basal body-associated protein FliL